MEAICTVLLISYNHAQYIEKAIQSVLEQKTEYPYVIHVFDDGSSDGTQGIIQEYEKTYPGKLKGFLLEKNQGAQNNFWAAIQSVQTKYFIFLECDDYWCDDKKLELQISALENHPECSFCGHNTRYITLDESSREYPDNTLACTEPLLKTKSIFTLEDFDPINTGGYIPYVSARLIRRSCINLSEIKHKETILFDFCQFYYLLLKGDYYYIDLPMSVYQRTGSGTCSGKEPLKFLNTFLQNAIDFNDDTNGCIANKIFRECQLQSSFRLLLANQTPQIWKPSLVKTDTGQANYRNTPENHLLMYVNRLNADEYYLLCNGGIGHTMTICGLKDALEEKYRSRITLLILKKHEFLMPMYGEKNYLVTDYTNVNLDALSNSCPNPEKGKIFPTHPFSHPEQFNFYFPMFSMQSSVDYLTWMKDFLRLPPHIPCKLPDPSQFQIQPQLPEKAVQLGKLDHMILFFPESYTLAGISTSVWKQKAAELKEDGYTVISCVENRMNTIPGTIYLELTLNEAIALGAQCHSVYSARSGICDALFFLGEKLHVYYSSHSAFFQYGLKNVFATCPFHEEIILQQQTYVAPTDTAHSPRKAKLFGILPVPEFVYRFYLRHKQILQPLKRLIKWEY